MNQKEVASRINLTECFMTLKFLKNIFNINNHPTFIWNTFLEALLFTEVLSVNS